MLLRDGKLRCWGEPLALLLPSFVPNDFGDEPGEMGSALPNMPLPATARLVALGRRVGCVVALDGGAPICWGHADANNIVGDGGAPRRKAFAPSDRGVDLAMSHDYGPDVACAVLEDGAVKCWGDNQYGQLGQGDKLPRTEPV